MEPVEARTLLDAIGVTTIVGLRDRSHFGLMVYSFARIGVALSMKAKDVFLQQRRLWVRLHAEAASGVKLPCHHNLEAYPHAYVDAAGTADDAKGPPFRTIRRGTAAPTRSNLPQANAYVMIGRRATAAGIETTVGNHTCRATGITAYLKNDDTLEKAAPIANHASTRTTQLFGRRSNDVTLDEVERAAI